MQLKQSAKATADCSRPSPASHWSQPGRLNKVTIGQVRTDEVFKPLNINLLHLISGMTRCKGRLCLWV